MKIMLDHNVPGHLGHLLSEHQVDTAASQGWNQITDKELLQRTDEDGYDILITADQGIKNQQNLADFSIFIIELSTPNLTRIRTHVELVEQAISEFRPSTLIQVHIPYPEEKIR